MSDMLSIARAYVKAGYSVIPVKADGSKSPLVTGWRKYSNELPSDEQLMEWFKPGDIVGIGVVPGPASGNLVILDFESSADGSAYFDWYKRLTPELQQFVTLLPTVNTPSGGKHIWVRMEESQPGGRLARYANGKTKIEVRGEGHQVLAPGCPAECHRTGKLYTWDTPPGGPTFNEFGVPDVPPPVLDLPTIMDLVDYCVQCNEFRPPEQPRDYHAVGSPAGKDSPGSDFNTRGSWSETGLFEGGWSWTRQVDTEKGYLTRPGKENGISASLGMVSSREKAYPYLWVWSTSVTSFASETPYSRFAVYAILKHDGDFSAAAKELSRMGYGASTLRLESDDPTIVVDLSKLQLTNLATGDKFTPFEGEKPTAIELPKDGKSAKDRGFKWSSELSSQSDDAKWIWEGYLARSGITLFSAYWKAGKTTFLAHLLKALDGSQTEFCGKRVNPSRVLYISEEDESILATRRDELLIGDHVGWSSRPFKGRASMKEWLDFLRDRLVNIREYQFDLIVIDTLSKMWPVREENDASQVDEALMPIWGLPGVAVLLVHHVRKGGGAQFTSSRGSGALPAFCEILMEFNRVDENDAENTQRTITAIGRYNETPPKVQIDKQPSGYILVGDPDDSDVRLATRKEDWHEMVFEIVEESGSEGTTIKNIHECLKTRRSGESVRDDVLKKFLKSKFDGGELRRSGDGVRGNPHIYTIPGMDDTIESDDLDADGTTVNIDENTSQE